MKRFFTWKHVFSFDILSSSLWVQQKHTFFDKRKHVGDWQFVKIPRKYHRFFKTHSNIAFHQKLFKFQYLENHLVKIEYGTFRTGRSETESSRPVIWIDRAEHISDTTFMAQRMWTLFSSTKFYFNTKTFIYNFPHLLSRARSNFKIHNFHQIEHKTRSETSLALFVQQNYLF